MSDDGRDSIRDNKVAHLSFCLEESGRSVFLNITPPFAMGYISEVKSQVTIQ